MTLIDSSVWIDFLRKPDTGQNQELAKLVREKQAATTDPITMELLMGPTDELAVRRVERLMSSTLPLDVKPHTDFDLAAALYRSVRRSGRTIRSKLDCLIAAIAIRHDVPLLHKDADFEAIAEVSELRQQSLL